MDRNPNNRRPRRDDDDSEYGREYGRDYGRQGYGRQSERPSGGSSRFDEDDRQFEQRDQGGRSTYGQSDDDSYGRGYGASYGSSFNRPGGQRGRGPDDDRYDDDRGSRYRADAPSRDNRERGGGGSGSYGAGRFGERDDRSFGSFGSNDERGDTSGYRRTGGQGSSMGGGSYAQRGYGSAPRRGYGSGEDHHDRGFFERAGDEIASWFGDEDAARRRESDHSGRGPANYTRSDERILEDACDHLTDDWGVDAQHIQVTVQAGEVTLDGTVPSRDQKRRAEDCVHDISGVKHVQNNLRINDRAADRGPTSDRSSGSGSMGGSMGGNMGGSSTGSGTTGTSGGYGSTDGDGHNRSDSTPGTLA